MRLHNLRLFFNIFILLIFALTLTSRLTGQTQPEIRMQSASEPRIRTAQSPTSKSSLSDGSSRAATPSTHERFAPFLAHEDFKSELLLQNIRLDVAVTVNPVLIVSQGEFKLEPITLAPHSTATVDINAALRAYNLKESEGVVLARYDFKTYGAVIAVVESTDLAHHLYLNFVAQSPEEFWCMESGAGIHLAFVGNPGDIVAEGILFKKKTGFTKHIRFMDTALKFSNSSLRTNFLLLGGQPQADGFPSQVSFRSVAVVRNIDSATVQVSPIVKFLQHGTTQKLNLAPLELQAGESRLIDFSQEQKTGKLPVNFTQGSLQLIPNTTHTSIVSELFNFNEHTGGYVVGSSFLAHPARATSAMWRIDGTYQTTIIIENTADHKDQVRLSLFLEAGSYEKTFPVAPGVVAKINLKELQQNGIRDNEGHLLLSSSGTLSLAGANGAKSALAFETL